MDLDDEDDSFIIILIILSLNQYTIHCKSVLTEQI